MENLDVQLIRRILSGDNEAFSTLVEKYQKGIHALTWREVGDFHFAEEITQDVFLQIYKKLATLKNPDQFSGWVYVITKNLCRNWRKRNTFYMQSLEETPVEEVEKLSYTNYVLEQRETRATEHRYAIVEKLLKKLLESERTVVTLYYLGEMTPNEISRFLGVSVNTINSRIRRARKRLQEKEEFLIHGILSSIKITTDLKKNVMEQVAEMKPTPSPTMKPLFPWTAFGTTMVLVMLALGAGNQYLTYFQKSYSFHVQSELTVEIVDASIILDIDTKLSPQNQTGILVPQRKSTGTDKPSDAETVSVSAPEQVRFFGL